MLKQAGLTLVEVLIAAVILFAALTVASETYRTNLISTERAARTAKLLAPLPLVVDSIRNQLRESPDERVSGEGEVLGIEFEFTAETVQFAPPPRRFDPDTLEFRNYAPRYRLYAVQLELRDGRHRREFEYRELAWLPEVL